MEKVKYLTIRFILAGLCLGVAPGFPSFCLADALPAWKLVPLGSTDKITASGKTAARLNTFTDIPIELDCVRGEASSFQFVVSAGAAPIQTLSVRSTGLASIKADILAPTQLQFFRENYVFVAHPSGNRIQTPKWWPDALIPLALAPQTIEPNASAVFWATLRIPRDATPGDYSGELDIAANGNSRRLALSVHVRSLQLPASHFRGTAALYYDVLRDWYRKNGNAFSDEEWTQQKQRYASFLLDFGLNPYDPPVAWNNPAIDDYLKDPRVHSVRTPPLDSPDFPAALEAFKRSATQSKAFYYWNDEPQTQEQFAAIKANSTKLRALGIPQLVTHHPAPELANSADIWCPNISNALGSGHLDIPELKREQSKNHPTWLYTMIVPRHPYPTWLLDDDSSAILSFAPLWNRVGASGCVYSMVHGWGPEPLENLESFQGTNGDGTLVYPAELVGGVSPMPSIRLMLLRDAIEDLALWNEATRRKIAPPFSFPIQRSGALVYDRTPLLDALQNGRRAPAKPVQAPGLFPEKPAITTFKMPFVRALDGTRRIQLSALNGVLEVRVRGPKLQQNEEFSLVLAPLAIEKETTQTRWTWNFDGKLSVRKRTNGLAEEVGLARLAPLVKFRVLADGFEVTLPLEENSLRFNILLRSSKGTKRLFFDGNDPFLLPILQLR